MKRNNSNKTALFLSFALVFTLIFSCFSINTSLAADGSWYDPHSVIEIVNNNYGYGTVAGYIVGQPTSSTQITNRNFPNDYAIAIANSPTETNTSKMLFVQVSRSFRSTMGLKSNPSNLGKFVKIEGKFTSYYSHEGVKNVYDMEIVAAPDNGGSTDNNTGDNSNNGSTDNNTGDNNNNGSTGNGGDSNTSYDETYYQTAMGKTGSHLKSELHNIIDDHTKLSYKQVWDALRYTDEDPNNKNNVILLYTGRSQSKTSNGGYVNNWNREHVWAKSHGDFGTAAGAGTDLHHLRPTDVSVNSNRGNLDFDNGGSYHSEATECKYDGDSWEPRDEVKGDVARMLFYMAVRYEGDSGEVDLELNNQVNNGKDPYHGKLSVLLNWHKQDPVSEFERNRNDIIFTKYQFNRNPFIDHPEWVDSIWGN